MRDIVFPIMNVSCNYKEPRILMMNFTFKHSWIKMTRAQMVFRYRMKRASDGVRSWQQEN